MYAIDFLKLQHLLGFVFDGCCPGGSWPSRYTHRFFSSGRFPSPWPCSDLLWILFPVPWPAQACLSAYGYGRRGVFSTSDSPLSYGRGEVLCSVLASSFVVLCFALLPFYIASCVPTLRFFRARFFCFCSLHKTAPSFCWVYYYRNCAFCPFSILSPFFTFCFSLHRLFLSKKSATFFAHPPALGTQKPLRFLNYYKKLLLF